MKVVGQNAEKEDAFNRIDIDRRSATNQRRTLQGAVMDQGRDTSVGWV